MQCCQLPGVMDVVRDNCSVVHRTCCKTVHQLSPRLAACLVIAYLSDALLLLLLAPSVCCVLEVYVPFRVLPSKACQWRRDPHED